MIDIAGAAVNDGADLALPMADGRRHAAEIGDVIDALDYQHIAGFGEIMRLNLA